MESNANDVALNPYKAPESTVIDTEDQGGLSHIFDRFSTWGVIGLSIITLGIYAIYWLYKRTEKLNPHTDEPIGAAFINTTIVFYTLSLFQNMEYFTEVSETLSAAIGFAAIISAILMYVWIFKIRNRINGLLNSLKGDDSWLGPIYTFFFSILYLQYKINGRIDSE